MALDNSKIVEETVTRMARELGFFSEHQLKILNKRGELVPFVLNADQLAVNTLLNKQRQDIGMVRIVVLKSRKRGISTYAAARFYHQTYFNPGTYTHVMAHLDDSSSTLFDIVNRFYDNQPREFRLSVDRRSAKTLRFETTDAGYSVSTAGSKATGRAKTIQRFHGSEVAFWPYAQTHMAGILEAVPTEPGTEIILESTANGAGGEFFDFWHRSKRRENIFIPVFLPWFTDKDNVASDDVLVALGMDDIKDFKPDDTERRLIKSFGISYRQLAWRRAKVGTLGVQLFMQEYPATDEEAFLAAGLPAIPIEWLQALRKEVYSPPLRGELCCGTLNERPDGELRVWERPSAGARYVIGADVAEGLAHGDYSSADVLICPSGRQVAQWHGHTSPDIFGKTVLHDLGKYYNGALVAVEANNHGWTTLKYLQDTGYSNLYQREDLESYNDGHRVKKAGWLTTARSKPLMIDTAYALIRDKISGIVSAELLDELFTFVKSESGSYGAMPGTRDDRVMSWCIAQQALRSMS